MIWPLLNKRFSSLALAAVFAAALTGCATGGLNEKPVALPEPLPATVNLDIDWWHILGDEHAPKSFGQLKPTVVEDMAYVALADGQVFSVSLAGDVSLVGQHNQNITAPLGVEGGQLLVSDSEGAITLYTESLDEVWRLDLDAVSTEAPLMTPSRIFVQTLDGRVSAVERITGRLLWSYQDAEPRLTLTGSSSPVLISTNSGDAIVTGLANGKLVALSVLDGSIIWEYRITRASGKTDVSRLVDVDAQVTVLDTRLIASSYQGDLIVVEMATGRVLQAKKFSSYRSILATNDRWFGVDAQSHIVSIDPVTLDVNWTNTDLEYRQVSELVQSGDYLFATDKAGYLHVIDSATGEFVASRHVDWRGAKTDPVAFGNGVLVQGNSTRLKLLSVN